MRNDYERTLSSLRESLKNIDTVISDYKKKFDDSTKQMEIYKEALKKVEAELSSNRSTPITKRLAELKTSQERIFKAQASFEKELRERIGKIESYTGISDNLHKSFDGFFMKNINTEKLIGEINNDKLELQKDLEKLKNKVLAFTLISGTTGAKSQLKDIYEELKECEKKKLTIKFKIEKLVSLIKGSAT